MQSRNIQPICCLGCVIPCIHRRAHSGAALLPLSALGDGNAIGAAFQGLLHRLALHAGDGLFGRSVRPPGVGAAVRVLQVFTMCTPHISITAQVM